MVGCREFRIACDEYRICLPMCWIESTTTVAHNHVCHRLPACYAIDRQPTATPARYLHVGINRLRMLCHGRGCYLHLLCYEQQHLSNIHLICRFPRQAVHSRTMEYTFACIKWIKRSHVNRINRLSSRVYRLARMPWLAAIYLLHFTSSSENATQIWLHV